MFRQVQDEPLLSALLGYWDGKRGARPMPARRDIDPVEMGGSLLPHLALVDLAVGGARARFRLVGTSLVRGFGFDPTGERVDDGASGYFAELARFCASAALRRAPVHWTADFRWGARNRLDVRHLVLPLTHGGADPAIALAGIVFASGDVRPPTIARLEAGGARLSPVEDPCAALAAVFEPVTCLA
jgi:hypothetical protein